MAGPVRVPEQAGLGKAKITLSFRDGNEGKAAPATFAIPIVEAQPKHKLEKRTLP